MMMMMDGWIMEPHSDGQRRPKRAAASSLLVAWGACREGKRAAAGMLVLGAVPGPADRAWRPSDRGGGGGEEEEEEEWTGQGQSWPRAAAGSQSKQARSLFVANQRRPMIPCRLFVDLAACPCLPDPACRCPGWCPDSTSVCPPRGLFSGRLPAVGGMLAGARPQPG